MKKALPTLLLISSLAVAACDRAVDNEQSEQGEKRLVVTAQGKKEYQQYDEFDFSSLTVEEQTVRNDSIVSTAPVTDFTLIDTSTKRVIDATTKLSDFGNRTLEVSKEGYLSTSFNINVLRVLSFSQRIELTSLPGILEYSQGEQLDVAGLTVMLHTTYLNRDGESISSEQEVEDYSLLYNNQTIDPFNFTLSSFGSYEFTVDYKSWDNKTDLTSAFTVFATQPKDNITAKDSYSYEADNEWTFNQEKMTVTITNPNKKSAAGDPAEGYYSPDQVDTSFGVKKYGENSYEGWDYTPSLGKTPLLVVPVVLPGYENQANETNWNQIKKVFFGSSADLNFESLHSYYWKSSFHQLDFTGIVTDYFNLSQDSTNYKEGLTSTGDVHGLAQEAVNWAKARYGLNLSNYDSDKNGTIDGLWMVYIGPTDRSDSLGWAYTDTTRQKGTATNPLANIFGWTGIDFLWNKAYGSKETPDSTGDAHVVIHETGHMLGLTDYYSYSGAGYSPLGGVDMMDNNVGDHNPYSKMLLGWIKPYVVTGAKATITIHSNQGKGFNTPLQDNVIVIPSDNRVYERTADGKLRFNLFDEYLVLDYYTYENLNDKPYESLNAETPHPLSIEGVSFSGKGGRLYHVDNRLSYYDNSNPNETKAPLYANPDDVFTETRFRFFRSISNSESGQRSESIIPGMPTNAGAYDEIRWIGRGGPYYAMGWNDAPLGRRPSGQSLYQPGYSLSLTQPDNASTKMIDIAPQFQPALGKGSETFDSGDTYSGTIHFDSIQ